MADAFPTLANVCGHGHWIPVRDGHHAAFALYLRHYSSRKKRSASRPRRTTKMIGPGEYLLFLDQWWSAVFAWRFSRYRLDKQVGVECTLFRNESPVRSSDLVREACALAWEKWPGLRLFTFVDDRAIRNTAEPGKCFVKAGWRRCEGRSKSGLIILECIPTAEE